MEENNLFLIGNVQEEESNLDDAKKHSNQVVEQERRKVWIVASNNEIHEKNTKELKDKEKFLLAQHASFHSGENSKTAIVKE
jgi:hypothetical protein